MTDTERLLHLADRARRSGALDQEHDALNAGITAMCARMAELEAEIVDTRKTVKYFDRQSKRRNVRITELEEEVARLTTGHDALLKTIADLITSIGYARHTLATEILGWAEPGEDYSLDQIVVHAVAEYRADQSTIRRLTV